MQLVVHVALVQEDSDHFFLPWKGGTGGQYLQVGKTGCHRIDMSRMPVIELDAASARKALAYSSQTGVDEDGNAPRRWTSGKTGTRSDRSREAALESVR